MRMNKGWAIAALLALTTGSMGIMAAPIGGSQITASTSLGQYLYFSIDQMTDGIVSDAYPWNGYASGLGVVSGRITLTLDQAYDVSSFSLWNDVNINNEGVRSFTLTFENAWGDILATTDTLSAVSMFEAQDYAFANVKGVKRVQLDVLTSLTQIEIREVAFNGEVSAHNSVPEPAGIALAALGLAAVGVTRRRR